MTWFDGALFNYSALTPLMNRTVFIFMFLLVFNTPLYFVQLSLVLSFITLLIIFSSHVMHITKHEQRELLAKLYCEYYISKVGSFY